MVAAFFGTRLPPEKLYKLANPNPETGTSNKDLVKTGKKLGFSVYSKNKADVKDIAKFLDKGLPVVVNFIEPKGEKEGHYSLVVGMTKTEIIFNDPGYGEGFRMGIPEFLSRWRSMFEPYQRWMMVAYKKPSIWSFFRKLVPARVFVRTEEV